MLGKRAYKGKQPSSKKVYQRPANMAPLTRANRVPMQRPLPTAFQPTGAEIKAIDIPSGPYNFETVAGAPTAILLNGIQTGAGFFNRVGARVEMKNLHIRGVIGNIATGVQGNARILIVYDRQPVGALPSVQDILQSRDQAGAATTSGNSEINLDNRDRFQILRDYEVYTPAVTYTAGVLTNGPQFPGNDDPFDVNVFIKLKGLGTHYKSSSNPTTIADISTGALYAMFVTTGTTDTWTFNGGFRLRYDDK